MLPDWVSNPGPLTYESGLKKKKYCKLVICSHSKGGKTLSYSRINTVVEFADIVGPEVAHLDVHCLRSSL